MPSGSASYWYLLPGLRSAGAATGATLRALEREGEPQSGAALGEAALATLGGAALATLDEAAVASLGGAALATLEEAAPASLGEAGLPTLTSSHSRTLSSVTVTLSFPVFDVSTREEPLANSPCKSASSTVLVCPAPSLRPKGSSFNPSGSSASMRLFCPLAMRCAVALAERLWGMNLQTEGSATMLLFMRNKASRLIHKWLFSSTFGGVRIPT